MEQLHELREAFGQAYVVPACAAIREWVEGPGAPVAPFATYRYIVPKSWFVSQEDVAWVVLATVFFIVGEIVWHGTVTKLLLSFFPKMSEVDKGRFKESLWQFSYYTPIWLFTNFFVLADKEWFYRTYLVWEVPFPNQIITPEVWTVYVIQMGWYLHCTLNHLLFDRRKSDFWPMLVHHGATLILLYSAFATGYHRCGVLTMWSLDLCDTFLHLTKACRFIDNAHPLPEVLKLSPYVTLVISWFYFRLFMFPVKVLYTASAQGLNYGGWINSDYWFFYNFLLFVVFALQIYWAYLILLSGYKFLRYGDELDDQRDLSNQQAIASEARRAGADTRRSKKPKKA